MKNIFLYLLIIIGCGKISEPNDFEGCWQFSREGYYMEMCLKESLIYFVMEDAYEISSLSLENSGPEHGHLKIYRGTHPFLEFELLEKKGDRLLVKDIEKGKEYHLYKLDMEFPSDSILNDRLALDIEQQKFTARMFAFSDRWKNE
ncbi:MAG: hypothetical protein R2788_17045 [Saprospiraceae bacterium]